jgi:hypothetical protein
MQAQDIPRQSKTSPRHAQGRSMTAQDKPKMAQARPKTAKDRPKTSSEQPQESFKTTPRQQQDSPRHAKNPSKHQYGPSVFWNNRPPFFFFLFSQDRPRGPKTAPGQPQGRPKTPKTAEDKPQDGPGLVRVWIQDATRWPHGLGLVRVWIQDVPRGPQDGSKISSRRPKFAQASSYNCDPEKKVFFWRSLGPARAAPNPGLVRVWNLGNLNPGLVFYC